MDRNGNIILNSLSESERYTKKVSEVPAGYLEVRLSTKGKVGAPEVVHVRNFKISEIVTLSLSDARELPIRLIEILNEAILEDVDVSKWHESEIEELMLYVFMTFYRDKFEDIPFPYDEKDIKFLEETNKDLLSDLNSGKWVPKTTIEIAKDVETFDLKDSFTPLVTVTNKKTGFHVTFDYIKYGDQVVIKNWMDSFFREEERKFDRLKKALEYNRGISSQLKETPESIDKLIPIDPEEEQEYRDYLVRRTQVITDVSHIVSIVDFNGEDVSNLSVGQKYEKLSGDPRIDYGLIVSLSKKQEKKRFGIKPEVSMFDPITREVVKRPISFRISSLLQAMQLSGGDDYDNGDNDQD